MNKEPASIKNKNVKCIVVLYVNKPLNIYLFVKQEVGWGAFDANFTEKNALEYIHVLTI